MNRLLAKVLVGVVLACGVVLGIPQAGHALNNYGPDPADFEDGWGDDEFGFAVTSPTYSQAQITQTWVALYFKTNTGNKVVTIGDVDLCTGKIGSAPYSGNNYTDRAGRTISGEPEYEGRHWIWDPGDRVTRFYATSGSYTSTSTYGVYSDSWSCYRDTRTLTIPGAQLAFDSNTGYYKATFTAQFLPGFGEARNHFHIRLNESDAIVGYDSTLSSTSFSLFRLYPREGYRTYNLRFAPDCSLTAPKKVSGYWYDDDNGDPDIQPGLLYMQLRKYRASDGGYVGTVPLSFSGVEWQFAGPEPNSYYVSSGSARQVRMDFTAEPGMRYIWRWNDVYYPNGLQFKLPYDSIYWVTGCKLPTADLRPSSIVDKPKISYPETATFQHFVNISNFTAGATVGYTIQRYRNGTAIGGAQSGNFTASGNGQFPLQSNLFTSSAADAGDKICERLTLTSGGNISNNPSEACTTVVVRPYLSATNNDVWAGSWFDQNNNKCAGKGARTSSISSWVSSGAGAVGEYGVFGLGAVTEFGSARAPGGNGLTFGNIGVNGQFGASTRCVPNYYSTIGTNGANWPGVAGIPGNGGPRKYFANGNLTINAGTMAAGTQAVLVVNGDVTITGNINYAATYGSGSTIPALWIVARGNIYVREGVTDLSGFYVAQGTATVAGKIHTCVRNNGTTYNPLTTTNCNSALTVAGALLADQVYWQRTSGTAAPGQGYGESVQFDTGLYLNSPLGSSTSAIDVQDLKELPPIY